MSEPNIRKPLGVLFILGLILVWGGLVMAATPWIAPLPWPVQAVVYLIAGVVWILPLGPVLRWMER
jgi:membrane protein implicated in regulation of membrane protease activity